MEVNQAEGGIFLRQKSFALKVLAKFSMENCKPTSTPMAVGMKLSSQEDHESTGYSFFVSMLSRFMLLVTNKHYKAGKRVLRYIKGTLSHGIHFSRADELKLIGYTDSDWAGSKDDMKSTSGYAFTLGSAMIYWSSRKQTMVAQSTV
ncbi:secreted RxLR effector protein 161-like [Gossypium raimondii]|uniref:secreted RxLR effector protein 161-like n=1 Tax=Gossypium raimondii TaxID=29730 RepID=UPI00227C2EA1|nr:secreted RxLR effector protein 161-like [Gossypium raimondii]